MPEPQPEELSPVIPDERPDPPYLDVDRPALEVWLELYRQTLPLKVGGLTAEQLCRRSVPPSALSLIGVVRHLSKVERYWFGNIAAGTAGAFLYCDSDPDGDFNGIDPSTALVDLHRHAEEVATARLHAAKITDLDHPLPGLRHGEPVNLRWVLLHMIEEYARHLGHVDLLREAIDGSTGY